MDIADIKRRVRNALAFGFTTNLVTAANNIPSVPVQLTPLEGPTLNIVEQRGFASNMPIGTPIVALFQSGDRSNGVITGSTAPSSRPALAGPEDAAVYGYGFIIQIRADGVHITAPDVWLSGNLHVAGEIDAQQGISSQNSITTTGDVVADNGAGFVSLVHHDHPTNGAPPSPGT